MSQRNWLISQTLPGVFSFLWELLYFAYIRDVVQLLPWPLLFFINISGTVTYTCHV